MAASSAIVVYSSARRLDVALCLRDEADEVVFVFVFREMLILARRSSVDDDTSCNDDAAAAAGTSISATVVDG